MARVVRVEGPARHFSLLRAADGNYLGSEDGRELQVYDRADDTVIWEWRENTRRCHHVVTGLEVDIEPLAQAQRCRIRRKDGSVTPGGGEFVIERGPECLPSAYLRRFKAHGWVCLAAILDPGTVAALQQIAVHGQWPRTADDHSNAPLNRSAAVAKAATEPVSLWLVRQYLRTSEIRLGHSPSLSVLDADDGECDVQGWHSDFPYLWGSSPAVGGDRLPTGESGELVLGVQRNVCVTEFTQTNGATLFKLGSHSLDVGPPREWGTDADYAEPGHRQRQGLPYDGPDADVIEAPAGSVILYDARTWHRAGVNHTHHRRAALLQAMTPAYILPFKDTSAPYKLLRDGPLMTELTERERKEISRLMVHKIVGPLGQHAITVDTSLSTG